MSENHPVKKTGKLRQGLTTGSCATAAAKAAALLLFTGTTVSEVMIQSPQGKVLKVPVERVRATEGGASAAVIKDAGDDPDITNGAEIIVHLSLLPQDLVFESGRGVGTVTQPGLDQPVGEPAINSGPRQMIRLALEEVANQAGYTGGFHVCVEIPNGVALAQKTFNPRLGIVGGLSIIGTTGIVEPMSLRAIQETIQLEIRQKAAKGGKSLLLISGNYSKDFLRKNYDLERLSFVVCSNFVRDSLQAALDEGFQEIILVGHIGKFVKLGISAANTHSSCVDGRLECLVSCALKAGAERATLLEVLSAVTTEAALEILQKQQLLLPTMQVLGEAIEQYLARLIPPEITWGVIVHSNKPGLPEVLYRTTGADEVIQSMERGES